MNLLFSYSAAKLQQKFDICKYFGKKMFFCFICDLETLAVGFFLNFGFWLLAIFHAHYGDAIL